MRSFKTERAVEVFRFDGWTARSKKSGAWKVEGSSGAFMLHDEGAGRWRFVFGNSAKGNQQRQTISADSLPEAVERAGEILFGINPVEAHQVADPIRIDDVLDRALDSANAEPYHRTTLKKHGGYFKAWRQKNHLMFWGDLRPEHLEAYARFQFGRGCSRKSVLHYLELIRIADRWVSLNEPALGNRVWMDFHLPKNLGKTLRYSERKRRSYLPISMLVDLLFWLRDHKFETSLKPGVALQGLCGLQLQEALRLTWDRAGTITIEEDRRHDPLVAGVKNEHRVRMLPLPRLVHQILSDLAQIDPRRKGPDLVIEVPNSKAYSHRVNRMFLDWNPAHRIPPKDLRNTLPTEAEKGGWMSIWVRRYFGHAPATIIERAYLVEQAVDEGIEEGSDLFFENLRKEVVTHIDEAVEKCKSKKLRTA